MKLYIPAICVCALGTLHPYAGMGQQKDTTNTAWKDTSRTLQTITIFSDKTNSVTPVQSLSGAALEKMNSLSVADAARFFSGVQLKDYGGVGGLKTLNVHSMGTNQLGVFYDGIQLGNAQNGTVDLGRFSLDNIEQIDLYNAQKGVIFQPAKGFASAASIYLESRKPVFKGDETAHGKFGFKTGSFGLINPSLRLEQKITNHISAIVSTEWTHANGRYRFRYKGNDYDTTAIRTNADIDAWRIEAGLYGVLKDSSTWHAQAYYYNSDRGLPGPVVSGKFQNGQRQWDRNLFFQGGYTKKFSSGYSLMVNAKYMYDYVRYLDTSIITIDGPLMNRFMQHEYYISAANQYKLTRFWDVALSADFQVNSMTAVNLNHFAIPTRYTTLVALATQLHFSRLDVQGSLLGTIVDENVVMYEGGQNRREYTPTVTASWQPLNTKALRVRAFYKNIFRMPTFNDLYYTTVGNPLLRPEFVKQYDGGFSYDKRLDGWLQYLSIQTDGYFSNVKDKIVAVPGKLFRWQMQNIGKVYIYGLDASVQVTPRIIPTIGTNFALKYTYQKALDMSDPTASNYKDQITYIPRHSGSFTANLSWQMWDFNYSFIYVGGRYFLDENIPEYYLKPYYTSDLSLSKNFKYRGARFKLTGEVNNVLNQYYDVIQSYPMPRRYYRFTISTNF
jgi:vitamin B12 transporter